MPNDQLDPKYLVDFLFRVRDIHLIAGPSRAGKSTLALQFYDDWSRGDEVFGHPSHPLPAVYVACDRSLESLHAHMEALDMDPVAFPHISMADHTSDEQRTVESAHTLAQRVLPEVRVLFLDGLETLCGGRITEHRDVTRFMLAASRLCRRQNLTIIGCIPSAKSKEGERYTAPQDRALGSIAWMKLSEMAVLIEPTRSSKPEDPARTVTLLPHRGVIRTFAYSFNGPRLQRQAEITVLPPMDAWLLTAPHEAPMSAKQIIEAGQALGLGRWKVYEWISVQLALGTLVRSEYGEYTVAGAPGADSRVH